jgi:ornithine--oxo-acid transaminase
MHDTVAAILVEPIQGEAGIVMPPEGFLRQAARDRGQHHALLMADEIQSGLGRTGKLFAYEHEGVRPDMVIIGKALSGGMYPVSAILADDEVMGVFKPGEHGSTFGGNPLGAAVAREAIRVLVEEKMVERVGRARRLLPAQASRPSTPPRQGDPRPGLWIGIELKDEAGGARRFCEALQHEGPALQGDPRP